MVKGRSNSCMRACMHACIYFCVRVCVHVCVHVCMCASARVCMYVGGCEC